MAGLNPLTAQGLLNRILTHVIVPSFPYLTVTAPYMAKSMVTLTFDGPFVQQEQTATGVVNSPEPYVMGQIVVSLLRSQPVANLWLAQLQTNCVLGTVKVYSDSTTFDPISLGNSSILDVDPGAFDGADPATKVTIKGVFLTNDTLWTGI